MLRLAKKSLACLPVLLLLTLPSIYRAQERSARDPIVKVDVDLVLINVTVSDTQGRLILDLKPENFQVWEDRVPQKVEYFSQEQLPLSAGVIFDASGSMQDKVAGAREAARTFMAAGTLEDEYFLIEFSNRPTLSEDFTSDVFRLQKHFISTPTRGRTALLDAVYLGLEKLKKHRNTKRALVLITDGEDNHSRYRFSDVREFVREQDVQIFAIGMLDPGSWRSALARSLLEDLADLTGGRALFPTSVDQLEKICMSIDTELKNQYLLGYRPTNMAVDGRWRKIQIRVSPPKGMSQLRVRTKTGYYGPSEAPH